MVSDSKPVQREPIDPQFLAMASHLEGLGNGLSDLLMYDVVPGHPAGVDRESREGLGLYSDRPGYEAAMYPLLAMSHAAEHMRGIAAIVSTQGVAIPAVSLVRPLLESASLAYYLLTPGISTRERIRRYVNVQIESAVETLRMLGPSLRREEQGLEIGGRIYWAHVFAERYGYAWHQAKARRHRLEPMRWLGERPPTDQRLMRDLLDDEDSGSGRVLHRVLSAVIHGQPHGVMLFILRDQAVKSTTDPGVAHVPVGITLEQLVTLTAPAVLGVNSCAMRSAAYYGWDLDAWHALAQPALKWWRARLPPRV